MKKYLIDTNIFLRAILEDHKTQSPKAKKFLEKVKASKDTGYYTTPWVITEIIWTLDSLYKYKKENIVRIIKGILNTPNLKVLNEGLIAQSLTLFEEKNIDFVDCLNFSISEQEQSAGIVSFDTDFDKLETKRIVL